eukprot:TRINITY_DN67205_c0_g1_i1.p1 TRINITY_DN67205_c0_g1~~TRINITY_DN67205_c0_g1_i1.p1  ORF type:complete len:146 (-),score=5.05 TRINITY_DN67205_c0_g1_i1:162-599(-)
MRSFAAATMQNAEPLRRTAASSRCCSSITRGGHGLSHWLTHGGGYKGMCWSSSFVSSAGLRSPWTSITSDVFVRQLTMQTSMVVGGPSMPVASVHGPTIYIDPVTFPGTVQTGCKPDAMTPSLVASPSPGHALAVGQSMRDGTKV